MGKVANQRVVVNNEEGMSFKGDIPYFKTHKQAFFDMCQYDLSKSEIKLWFFFMALMPNTKIIFWSADAARKLNVVQKTVQVAFNGLIEKGFIEDVGGSLFVFNSYSSKPCMSYTDDQNDPDDWKIALAEKRKAEQECGNL